MALKLLNLFIFTPFAHMRLQLIHKKHHKLKDQIS